MSRAVSPVSLSFQFLVKLDSQNKKQALEKNLTFPHGALIIKGYYNY
jgi:hypothetical protein